MHFKTEKMFRIKMKFWEVVARLILRNRIFILFAIAGITIFMVTQWKYLKMSYTEANMLPKDHIINRDYDQFIKTFGEEANMVVIGGDIMKIFTEKNFQKWNALASEIEKFPEVAGVLGTHNLRILKKDTIESVFKLPSYPIETIQTAEDVVRFKEELLEKMPFYKGLLYNKEKKTLQMAISLKKEVVNTPLRKQFVLNKLIPVIERYQEEMGMHLATSGMPYIRTINTEIITGEIGLFIIGALSITCFILFMFFRSFRAMFIAMGIVVTSVVWSFGTLGLLGYEITILTAVIPPLLIVIGLPNCIFLINKYQQEINKHQYKMMGLQRMIAKVGNVTLITNLTTAMGFATFIITESDVLKEFGVVASINILTLFALSLCIIPIIYSFMPIPKEKHLRHLNKKWLEKWIYKLENVVKHHSFTTYSIAVGLLVFSVIGIYQIRISGSVIEDMPKNTTFFDDILFFEEEFGGVMPLEITIDTKRKNGVARLSTLQKIEQLEEFLRDTKDISEPISIVHLVKYAKQAFYNGNPSYFELPTNQEQAFLLPYIKKSNGNANMLKGIVDSTGQIARITVFMKDIGTEKMAKIEEKLAERIEKIFPKDQFEVKMTGKAYVFLKGTPFLVKNLLQSLLLTIFLIGILMFYMFRSFRMVLISIIPNMLPLLVTAGMMGFFGISLKPSTILVFGIAFGISVDDTLHFLAKYRQELIHYNWKIRKSVYSALRETGVSMFYTSVVLFFGFLVFILSDFGGTKALGGLIAITLFFAMLSNLVLLPSLLLSLERSIANKETIKEPSIDLFTEED